MKKLLFILLLPFMASAQNDTIYKTDGSIITGKITQIEKEYLRYNPNKGPDGTIVIQKVQSYVCKGEKVIFLTSSGENRTIQNTTVVNLADDYTYLKTCLGEAHSEFKSGSRMLIGGVLVSGVGAYIAKGNIQTGYAFVGFGSILGLIGTLVIFDSNKWIGRASLGLNGNGATVTYRFK